MAKPLSRGWLRPSSTGGALCRPLAAGSRTTRSLREPWRERPRLCTPRAATPAASAWSLTPRLPVTVGLRRQRDPCVVTARKTSRVPPHFQLTHCSGTSGCCRRVSTAPKHQAADETRAPAASRSFAELSGWTGRRPTRGFASAHAREKCTGYVPMASSTWSSRRTRTLRPGPPSGSPRSCYCHRPANRSGRAAERQARDPDVLLGDARCGSRRRSSPRHLVRSLAASSACRRPARDQTTHPPSLWPARSAIRRHAGGWREHSEDNKRLGAAAEWLTICQRGLRERQEDRGNHNGVCDVT